MNNPSSGGVVLEILPVDQEVLHRYEEFVCSKCCYWLEGKEVERDHDKWERWHEAILGKFGPPVVAAFKDRIPIGMVMFSPPDLAPHVRGIQPFDIWNSVPASEQHLSVILYCIYVPEERYKRKGVGRALMSHLIDRLSQPQAYLSGGHFRRIYSVGAAGRPGPSVPISFLGRFGFEKVRDLGSASRLMRLDLP